MDDEKRHLTSHFFKNRFFFFFFHKKICEKGLFENILPMGNTSDIFT